jgi:diguanylate cyclase (GGDEF)-like protein/PAS domain S-box-containing protein
VTLAARLELSTMMTLPNRLTIDVLLVEDNPGDARLIREMLNDAQDAEWRLIHVDRLDSAIELLASKRFDVCLLDLNLPDSQAQQTLGQLYAFFKLPILVLTGLDDKEMGLAALKNGAQDYLVKGNLESASLSRAIRYALERNRLEQRFSKIFNFSSDAILIFDPEGRSVLEANPKAVVLLGYSREELLDPSDKQLAWYEGAWLNLVKQILQRGKVERESITLLSKSGQVVHVEVSASVIKEDDKELVVATLRDVTEQRYLTQRLEQQSNYDALTSLPNRRFLERHVQRFRPRVGRAKAKTRLALIYLSLKGFKRLNDSLGSKAGDELLVQVAERLTGVLRGQDVVARTDGDEFAVLHIVSDARSAVFVTRRIQEQLKLPFVLEGNSYHLSGVMGVVEDDGNLPFAEMLRRARQTLYQAQRQGSETVFYNEQVDESLRDWVWLERELRKAISQQDFSLHFQPLPSLRTNEMHAEVLLRWSHLERGFISPVSFIPVAEETGLIVQLDRWVLKTSVNVAAQHGFHIAVNVSPATLSQEGFTSYVKSCLDGAGLEPSHLILEVTETVFANPEKTAPILNELGGLGIHIMVDDFGTGYSSLGYLLHYPLSGLKVDRKFIHDLKDDKARLIAGAIVQLAKSLELQAIAEGIETEEQLRWAKEAGCAMAQGYLFAKPMPLEEFLSWRERHLLASLPVAV